MRLIERLKRWWRRPLAPRVSRGASPNLTREQVFAAVDQGLSADDLIALCGPEAVLTLITEGAIFYDRANERFWRSKTRRDG